MLRIHLRSLAALTANLVRKLFIVLPSDHGREIVKGYVDVDSVASALPFEAVVIHLPNNTLGSYGMYLETYRLSEAAGDGLDYYIFSEDDYVPMRPRFDEALVRMYKRTFGDGDGVLCGVLQGQPVEPQSKFKLHAESSHIMSARTIRHVYERTYGPRAR